jgi:hypothetical protein
MNIILSRRSKWESIMVLRKILDRGGEAQTLGTAFNLGAQADARGATQVLDRGGQAVARGAVPCASKVLGRGAEAVARGAARCASHVFDRGAQAVWCPDRFMRRRNAAASGEEHSQMSREIV